LHVVEKTRILDPMPPSETDVQSARRQLDRILESPGFSRNERLSRFLRFVVEGRLEGREQDLKESVLAVEVFGRKTDYDPRRDPIVRTEAIRLRTRLAEYYSVDGRDDELVIELPKGGYVPQFVPRAPNQGSPADARQIRGRRRSLFAALGGLAVVLAGAGWWLSTREKQPIAIAVLPLENLSHNANDEYFADGLTAELIRNLSLFEGLAPRSQTSSFAFKNKPRNLREVGQQLGVEYILEGSVLRDGQQLRIIVHLVRVRDDFPLWSGQYDRELTDMLAVQDEISRGIVNGLRLKLESGRRRYETSVAAYDQYLRGRAADADVLKSGATILRNGLVFYEQAISKDPAFAPAYAALASSYAHLSATGAEAGRDEDIEKMRAAAEKALELDPLLPEAYDGMGEVYARDAKWTDAERSFRRALGLDPASSLSRLDFAYDLLLPLGRIDEAVRELRTAEKLDPLSPVVQARLDFALLSARRFEEVAARCEKEMNTVPNPQSAVDLGRARVGQGRFDEAIRLFSSAPAPAALAFAGNAYGRAGRGDEARKIAGQLKNPFMQSLVLAGFGDKDGTLGDLELTAKQGPLMLGRRLTFPEFNLIRGDPRVKELRRKVGLP
jgi:TolB-like protein/Flp pilus assembly protein TadD